MDVSDLKKLGGRAIAKKLGIAKRRSTLSIAASVVGVATVGAAIGYGVSRFFKRGAEEQTAPDAATKKPAGDA